MPFNFMIWNMAIANFLGAVLLSDVAQIKLLGIHTRHKINL